MELGVKTEMKPDGISSPLQLCLSILASLWLNQGQDLQTSWQPLARSQVLPLPVCTVPRPSLPHLFKQSLYKGLASKHGVPKASNCYLRSEHTRVRGIEIGPFAINEGIGQTQTRGTPSPLSPFSWDFQIGSGFPPFSIPLYSCEGPPALLLTPVLAAGQGSGPFPCVASGGHLLSTQRGS